MPLTKLYIGRKHLLSVNMLFIKWKAVMVRWEGKYRLGVRITRDLSSVINSFLMI